MTAKLRRGMAGGVLACALFMGSHGGQQAHAATNVTIDWNDVLQEIDGFGVSQADWSNAIYDLNEPERSEVMDHLFREDTGIGLSIFRGELFAAFNPAPGQYDFGARPDQVWIMQQAAARGVDKIMTTTWSPPAWMKTNNSTTNGGFLKTENYDDYAALMAKFIKEYEQQYGIDLYAVSIANEPNSMTFLSWDSSEWNSTHFMVFIKNHLKAAMIAEGVQDTKVIAGESSWWSEDLIKDALNDTGSEERIDIVAGHNYPIPILNVEMPPDPFDTAVSYGKKVWMTEVSHVNNYDPGITSGLKFARQMHTFLTRTGVNAWLYWTGAIPGDNDEGLINVNLNDSTYNLTKRFYAIGNYSKFIRPGYERIGMPANPKSGLFTSAYRNPATGEFTIVAINDSDTTAELNMTPSGFAAGSLTPYTTNASVSLAEGNPVLMSGGSFETLIPPRSVVTFVGQNGSPAPAPLTTLTDPLDNWNYTSSHTSGLMLDATNSQYFSGDTSRVKRSASGTESFIYAIPDMRDFRATLYHYNNWNGVAFYTSPDGVSWTPVTHVSTPGVHMGSQWYRKIYAPQHLLPAGSGYLKVELSGSDSWEKQVSQMVIASG